MKNYKVRVIRPFNDMVEKTDDGKDRPRKINELFYCTKERYEYLKLHKVVELMGIDKTPAEQVVDTYKQEVTKISKPKRKKKKDTD